MSLLRANRTLVDLHAEPDHRSERISQLFFNDEVTADESRNGFTAVTRHRDNYHGWAELRYLTEGVITRKAPTRRIGVPSTMIADSKTGTSLAPYRLLHGTEIAVTRAQDRVVSIVHPRNGRIPKAALQGAIPSTYKSRWSLLLRQAQWYLGAPYLWGGISLLGCDCSGLVQTLYGQVGVPLPRDSKDQRKAGSRVERSEIRPGDLIFSPGHVAIAVGNDRILHSSRSYGGVAIQSLNPKDDMYRKDIDTQFEECRRVW